MKNRKISFLLVIALVFSVIFAGCGGQKEDIETDNSEQETASQSDLTQDGISSETYSKKTENNETAAITEEEETLSLTATQHQTASENETDTQTAYAAEKTSSGFSSTNESQTEKTTSISAAPLSSKFFDDAVFVGDSVTLGLRNYVTSERNKGNDCLGKAQFLTAGSMGYTNTAPEIGTANSIHPKYQGRETRIEDALKQMGAKKVFIMLGMNDFCAYPTETGIANAKKCLKAIADKNPGIKIYVESVTPTMNNKGKFTNQNIDAFNRGLKSLCSENGWTYVDVSSVMKNSAGNLVSSYCSDPDGRGVHMTYEGCRTWISYLVKTYK